MRTWLEDGRPSCDMFAADGAIGRDECTRQMCNAALATGSDRPHCVFQRRSSTASSQNGTATEQRNNRSALPVPPTAPIDASHPDENCTGELLYTQNFGGESVDRSPHATVPWYAVPRQCSAAIGWLLSVLPRAVRLRQNIAPIRGPAALLHRQNREGDGRRRNHRRLRRARRTAPRVSAKASHAYVQALRGCPRRRHPLSASSLRRPSSGHRRFSRDTA
jgi:hypothetical protein